MNFDEPDVYFRPFETVWRYVIAYGFDEGIFGYNIFLVACLALMTIAFALVCHPRNMRDLTAFLVALAVLVGHHAMQASWETNIIISNGVVLLAGIVSIAHHPGERSAVDANLRRVADRYLSPHQGSWAGRCRRVRAGASAANAGHPARHCNRYYIDCASLFDLSFRDVAGAWRSQQAKGNDLRRVLLQFPRDHRDVLAGLAD